MLKHIYKGVFGVLLIGFTACTTEQLEDDLTPGTTPIQLRGAVTRAGGSNGNLDGYSNLYLSATTGSEGTTDFFNNIAITGITTNTTDDTKSDLKTGVYYPLNKETKINLYGHTGVVTGGKMNLTSGTDITTNDVLISNGADGKGTPGSAKDPVELLTFRHVMTRLDVAIEVDKTSGSTVEEDEPTNISFKFDNSVLPSTGTYGLTNSPTDAAVATGTNAYILNVGTHYVVPTGANLTGTNLIKSLIIDDYAASNDDLSLLEIPQANNNATMSDLILSPGLHYELTFVIKRLKVVKISVTMKPWDIKTGNGEWDYEAHKVKMNVTGGYENNSDKISKIVLHYTTGGGKTYQYIGSCEGEYTKFLTLPADLATGTLKADLYTPNGLLIEDHPITCSGSPGSQAFDITLSANGMAKDAATSTYYEVGTPLQFYNLISSPDAENYKLTNNIDINSLPLPILQSANFPSGGEFDGNGHSILHLDMKGSGLFIENNGTLKGIHIAFSSIDATTSGDTYIGSICSINNGSIEGCINEADIKAKDGQTVGGICGQNNGTILACLNTGNIPNGAEIGGICGENESVTNAAIKACINAGMLHGSSNHGQTTNIGGICGYQSQTSSNIVINTCYWLTGTARPVQGSSEEKAIGKLPSGGNLANYCSSTTNMTETLLRTEAVTRLNAVLTATPGWKFEWVRDSSTGTYETVWPIPVKN